MVGEGEGSRMQVIMDTFSADTEQRVMLSTRLSRQDLALSLFASNLARTGPMVTKQKRRGQTPRGKQARLPDRGLRTRAFEVVRGTEVGLGTRGTFTRAASDFPDTIKLLTALASP